MGRWLMFDWISRTIEAGDMVPKNAKHCSIFTCNLIRTVNTWRGSNMVEYVKGDRAESCSRRRSVHGAWCEILRGAEKVRASQHRQLQHPLDTTRRQLQWLSCKPIPTRTSLSQRLLRQLSTPATGRCYSRTIATVCCSFPSV